MGLGNKVDKNDLDEVKKTWRLLAVEVKIVGITWDEVKKTGEDRLRR